MTQGYKKMHRWERLKRSTTNESDSVQEDECHRKQRGGIRLVVEEGGKRVVGQVVGV